MENKTGKYFKYAVGEIVLVVIGIFIALQLNTWKENKEKSDLGYSYLIEMRQEINQDLIKIDYSIERLNKSTKNQEAALNTLSIAKLPLDSLRMIISPVNIFSLTINELTHDKMKNLGLTSLTKNIKLNTEIRNYYNNSLKKFKKAMHFSREELRKYQTFFLYELNSDIQKLGLGLQVYKEFPSLYDQSEDDFKSTQRTAIVKFIKSNKGKELIIWDLGGKRISDDFLNKFKGLTEKLLKSIDAELNEQQLQIK